MITTVSLVIIISYRYKIKEKENNIFFLSQNLLEFTLLNFMYNIQQY